MARRPDPGVSKRSTCREADGLAVLLAGAAPLVAGLDVAELSRPPWSASRRAVQGFRVTLAAALSAQRLAVRAADE